MRSSPALRRAVQFCCAAWCIFQLAAEAHAAGTYTERLPQDEVVYFLLPDRFENQNPKNDRGGLKGDRLKTGFDPTSKAFYNGGDFAGITARLDYIQALGATAIWLAPVFKNKPVQGAPGAESAGYHGYWVTDFTRVDPHFGTEAEFRTLVDAAHARGMKVYLDIIANHTADVISYSECDSECVYRSHAEYPYARHRGVQGEPINQGFEGDDAQHQTANNFAKLTRPDYAYTPVVRKRERHVKVPEWLNDPIYYHNRGNSTFAGESSEFGDFVGLDDLMTENPRVVAGFIDIYGQWIEKYRIDGFRIDTARHVNPEFWRAFVPAMLDKARAAGVPHFHIFGEVATSEPDVAQLARYTRVAALPAVLDFGFANAVREAVAEDSGTEVLARVFADDVLYEGGSSTAAQLPIFISNHDMGRFAHFVRRKHPDVPDAEVLARVRLATAMMLTLRGVPVMYYGDEQGFVGTGGDQDARQDMFATRVESYRSDRRIGGSSLLPFDTTHPLFTLTAKLASLRRNTSALARGEQVVRSYSEKPGLFAVSRFDPESGREVAIAFNTSDIAIDSLIQVNTSSQHFSSLFGDCVPTASAPGSYSVHLPAFGFAICASEAAR
ncbi:MAG TPA: alpha-amylase family glycosyl hydrolase [Steroidobacteraceae bacterium]|nr:alpha-amylase family glycosyl hydrolase [Steroidobacteraceae bacterium]